MVSKALQPNYGGWSDRVRPGLSQRDETWRRHKAGVYNRRDLVCDMCCLLINIDISIQTSRFALGFNRLLFLSGYLCMEYTLFEEFGH